MERKVSLIFLDSKTALDILSAMKENKELIRISLDLGISESKIDPHEISISKADLQKIVKDSESIYFKNKEGIFQAALRGKHFYKLIPSKHNHAPALLIDGVLMHRVKEMDPMEDARMKASLCAKKGMDMLEICTGLGYSTIACLEKEVRSILSIELDHHVIELSQLNPWSKRIHQDSKVKLITGNAVDIIRNFDSASFDSILHDPPRFPWGSELYTEEFYTQLFRVLRRNGTLYHYVGNPGSKYRKQDIPKGVISRLRRVGFRDLARVTEVLGVFGKKV